VSGLAYLGLDALINGNGAGIANVGGILQDPTKPYQPDSTKPNYNPYTTQPWGTSAVNYFFEAGLSTGVQYVLQQPFATGAPLANPQIFNAIKLAFQIGSGNLWITAYTQALATIAVLLEPIKFVGQYLYRGIGSYIGPNFATIDTLYDYNAYAGIPGVLRYIGGVLTTPVTVGGITLPIGNPNPYPTAAPEPGASVAALSSPVAAAKSASPDTGTATPGAVKAEVAVPKAGETPADSTPAAGGSSESTSTEALSDTTVSDTKSADTTPAVDSPSSAVADSTADASPAATKPADAPAKASKRPVRSVAERAAKKVASAISRAADDAAASVSK